jgi:hypothetical protein
MSGVTSGPGTDPEQQLREAFASTSAGADPAILDRSRLLANRRRRRRDIGVALGSGAAALAVVGGLVLPQVLGGDRPAGGPIAVAARGSGEASPSGGASDAPATDAPAQPSESAFPGVLPTATPSETPSAIIPDWPTARPGPAGTIPDSVLPSMAELGAGVNTEGNRFTDSVGSAPLMGAQYCDALDVSNMPGGDKIINPVRGGLMSAYKAPQGDVAVDVTVNLFATKQGKVAFDQLLVDRGFCRWYEVTPTPAQPAGGADAGQSFWTFTGSARPGHLAGGLVRRGDVIVGVVTTRASESEALTEAKRLLTLTANRVSEQMPEAKG